MYIHVFRSLNNQFFEAKHVKKWFRVRKKSTSIVIKFFTNFITKFTEETVTENAIGTVTTKESVKGIAIEKESDVIQEVGPDRQRITGLPVMVMAIAALEMIENVIAMNVTLEMWNVIDVMKNVDGNHQLNQKIMNVRKCK